MTTKDVLTLALPFVLFFLGRYLDGRRRRAERRQAMHNELVVRASDRIRCAVYGRE